MLGGTTVALALRGLAGAPLWLALTVAVVVTAALVAGVLRYIGMRFARALGAHAVAPASSSTGG